MSARRRVAFFLCALAVLLIACGKRKKGPSYRAVSIAAHGSTACIVMADASVRCWGAGFDSTPEVVKVDAGSVLARKIDDATCVVLENHDVKCSGTNADIVVDTSALHDIADIAVGGHHACARALDQTLWCWGKNDRGQLGDGTTLDHGPARVPNLAGIEHVAAGAAHTCAHRGDDTIRCWGDDSHHQLGLGAPGGTALSPTLVPGLYEAVDVAAGDFFTCARMTDGWIRCWGANEAGQIGDGTPLERAVPVPVRM